MILGPQHLVVKYMEKSRGNSNRKVEAEISLPHLLLKGLPIGET